MPSAQLESKLKIKEQCEQKVTNAAKELKARLQSHPGRLWILQMSEVHPPGSPHYQYVNLVSAFTKVLSWMPFPYVMAGTPLQLQLVVSVAQASWCKRGLPDYPP